MTTTNVIIGLINPKTPANVGSVLRAAGCFGVEAVFYTGERYERAAQFNTDTKSVNRNLPLHHVANPCDSIPAHAKLVCVELAEGAIPLPAFQHPDNAVYLFGPEDGTLEQNLIDRADAVVYVPTIGCLNLAATVNVVLYDRLAKSTRTIEHNDLIRRSRDTNNRLKVK